ncbi:M48 family metallopeptidase [Achromobacter sp. GG226]|nr:M48 family metallopeptidase [Verticiella sp. GG226]
MPAPAPRPAPAAPAPRLDPAGASAPSPQPDTRSDSPTDAAASPLLDLPGAGPAALPPGTDLALGGSGFVPTLPPTTLPAGARWREVATPAQTIGFVLLRSKRRTIGFLITDDGLRVTAPRWVGLGEIDEAVRGKASWILSRLRTWQERQQRVAMHRARWEDGGELPYLGQTIRFRVGGDRRHFAGDALAPQAGDTLWLGLPSGADGNRIRDTVQAWLQGQARAIIQTRLDHFLQRTGLAITQWRLSSARTRWGSCTSQGHIMLNWRLVHFAVDVIDYVIAHELAHLREMNHGPGFWTEVGHILPGYEQARQTLRQHDPASLPSFT